MKDFKQTTKSNILGSSRAKQTISKKSIESGSKKNILKQVDKLRKQIQNANDDIKKTQKLLDVDLFLQQQKKKRLQYAKQLNSDFEFQKKQREQKLYKKFKREEKTDEQKIQFRTQNVAAVQPIVIVKNLVNQHIDREWVKNGHHFKPQDIEVTGLREKEQVIFKNLYQNSSDNENQKIVWKDIKKVAENPMEIVTLPTIIPDNGLIPNDFQSENILSALCFMNQKICRKTFAENDKIIISEFFTPTQQVTVVIDKQILVRQFNHKDVNLGSRSFNPNILWPTLMQKSFKKLQRVRNLNHIANSIQKCIYTIYGLDAELVPITNKNVIKQNFPLVLGHLLQEGKVGFLNLNDYSQKSYSNRIYLLEQVKEQVETRGKTTKKQIKYKIKNPWRGKLIDSGNSNRFNLLQLLELFNCLVILRDYPKKWSCLRINSNYFSNGGVGATGSQWTKNPQYLFVVTKPTNVRIVLRKSVDQNQSQKQQVYGFLLFHNKQIVPKLQTLKMDWLITKTKCTDLQQSCYSGKLAKGHYIVIPYTTTISDRNYQFYTFDFFVQNQKNFDFGKARVFDYNYTVPKAPRLNAEKQKVVQSLESVQKFEKPKVLKIEIISHFHSKITEETLQKLSLNLFKDIELGHFFVPGFVGGLIINRSVDVQTLQNKRNNQHKEWNQVNEQLSKQEQAQNLQILLGYDAISDEINQGLMKQYIEQSVGVFDFKNYALGQDGLTAVLEALSQSSQLIELDFSGNQLNDAAITFLCYYLEKGDRVQLKKLNVERNNFSKTGQKALKGLKTTFPKLDINGI